MAQLSSAEVYQLREMFRITGNKRSRFDNDLRLDTVVENMVHHVINTQVLVPPYIACITVKQILRGGKHWKGADKMLSAALLSHAGIAQPPNWYLAEQGKRFGYIMDWPPVAIRQVVTNSLRRNFINPLLDNNEDDNEYIIGWCKGYINEENGKAKYIPEYGMFTSSYFILAADPALRPDIESHILKQDWWYRKQFQMMLEKLPQMVLGGKRSADLQHRRWSALGNQWCIDENTGTCHIGLDPQVPDSMIDWRDVDEIED